MFRSSTRATPSDSRRAWSLRAAAVLLTLPAAAGLTACTSNPLDASCSDFMGKSQTEQLRLATMVASPTQSADDKMAQIVAPTYRDNLLSYCPSHPNDQLKNLLLMYH